MFLGQWEYLLITRNVRKKFGLKQGQGDSPGWGRGCRQCSRHGWCILVWSNKLGQTAAVWGVWLRPCWGTRRPERSVRVARWTHGTSRPPAGSKTAQTPAPRRAATRPNVHKGRGEGTVHKGQGRAGQVLWWACRELCLIHCAFSRE